MNRSDEIAAPINPTGAQRLNRESEVNLDWPTADDHGKQAHPIPRSCSLDGVTEITRLLQGLELATLERFDTIIIHTFNSHYRIFLLDPDTGRALLDGGQITEPIEVRVIGSSFGGSMLRTGWICVGLRLEACANDKYIRTSPIRSLYVEHHPSPELVSNTSQ